MDQKNQLHLSKLDYSVLQQCMHCGMCLPTCPTYVETQRERNSPRGRIALMRSIADGELEVSKTFGDEMYYCLGCLACVTACPAGVEYPHLFEAARADVEETGVLDSRQRRFWRWLSIKKIFMSPRLLHAVGQILRTYQQFRLDRLFRKLRLVKRLPGRLSELEQNTPRIRKKFSASLINEWESATDEKSRFKVGLLTGCVQDLVLSEVNRDTADVLLANGCRVYTPRRQSCCGSLQAHNGELALARELARRQIDQFDLETLDAVISNAGGCGSHLKEYGKLLADDPDYRDKARVWDSKLYDIHEWLEKTKWRIPNVELRMKLTYHDSCHLCHSQKVTQQPREILKSIRGIELVELPEASWCCGSAGVYNITQPEQAAKLRDRKIKNIQKTGCSTIITANPGCHLQIEKGLELKGESGKVFHTVSILAQAYREEEKFG